MRFAILASVRTGAAMIVVGAFGILAQIAPAQIKGLQPNDYQRLRSVGDAQFSPDGKLIAYTIVRRDRPGRAWAQLWVLDIATGKTVRIGAENDASGDPVWSPDNQWIAYSGSAQGKHGLVIAHPDGSAATFLAEVIGTNTPLPSVGADVTWSPDCRQIAFVSTTPGPETAEASGDPVVITRYLYKPDAGEGLLHFNDNRRQHIFIVDLATKQVRQLTDGIYYEHSINWSPDGDQILFISDRSSNPDQFFNYDVFAIKVNDGVIRRLTATENAEYSPKWSPDGKTIAFSATRRGLTDRETTMEDTHVWLMNRDGSNRHELVTIDNRQGRPVWAPDGHSVYCTIQERGNIRLYRQVVNGGKPEAVISERGGVGAFSVSKTGAVTYVFAGPRDMPELYIKNGAASKQLTDLNADVLHDKQIGEVESFTFVSNDNRYEVEAFLTKSLNMTESTKHPLIVNIHGGPHGQNGPAFTFKDQVYAGRGWATLHVNFRGSTGYGQAFADAIFGDQNGNEAQDVLYGVSAALRRYLWLDRERVGIEGISYGGQLTD